MRILALLLGAAVMTGCTLPALRQAQGDTVGTQGDTFGVAPALRQAQGDTALRQAQGDTALRQAQGDTVVRGKSWMAPEARRANSVLMYVSETNNNVEVYNYPGGKLVGTLTGFNQPGSGCVDTQGDVYITEMSGSVVEYAHGGTKVIRTFEPGGDPAGCSVDAKGDLAVTSWSPGGVTIYRGAKGRGKTYGNTSCEYQWPMGYDDKGDLIGVGEYLTVSICAVMAGSKKETTLSTNGITIDYPAGTMWDGKYVALGDQKADGKLLTAINAASLSDSGLTERGEAVLTDTCYSDHTDVIVPFIVGTKNTPVNRRQAEVVAGVNKFCADIGVKRFGLWHYPEGGNPFKSYYVSAVPTGVTVSIGT